MPWTEGVRETGTVRLGGREFPVNRIITEQERFIEVSGGNYVMGHIWELIKEEDQSHNQAFVYMEGEWIEGYTFQRRWSSGNGEPERQNIFVSNDKHLSFVVTSERITV